MKRVRTGIYGLDKLLKGGFIEGKSILLSGPCGSGKTTIAMQFVLNGILKNKEAGLYLTLEQDKEKIRQDMANFGFNLKEQEKNGKLILLGGKVSSIQKNMEKAGANIDNVLEELREVITDKKIRRVVVDSLNLLVMFQKDNSERRKIIAKISNLLSELNCTSVLTSEIPEETNQLSTFGVEEYVLDGVIKLTRIKEQNRFLNLIGIIKMRGTDHSRDMKLYDITKKGVQILDYEVIPMRE